MECSSQLTTSTAPSLLSSHYHIPTDICKLIDDYTDKRVTVKYYPRVYYYKAHTGCGLRGCGRPPRILIQCYTDFNHGAGTTVQATIETGLYCGYGWRTRHPRVHP